MPLEPPKKDSPSPWEAMEWAWDVLVGIAAPTVLFALGGHWLDLRYSTTPFFTILGLIVALVISSIIVVRKGKDMSKRL